MKARSTISRERFDASRPRSALARNFSAKQCRRLRQATGIPATFFTLEFDPGFADDLELQLDPIVLEKSAYTVLVGTNFSGKDRPGTLAKQALAVETLSDFETMGKVFRKTSDANYKKMKKEYKDEYQQFFFKVRDDVGQPVADYFIDFTVQHSNGKQHEELTAEFDEKFGKTFYRHSADSSCRAMLLECNRLRSFKKKPDASKTRLVFDITAVPHLLNISYKPGYYVIYDGKSNAAEPEMTFIYPNTTTLVDIIMNRVQTDKLLNVVHGLHSSLFWDIYRYSEK